MIDHLVLKVGSQEAVQFYTQMLGMELCEDGIHRFPGQAQGLKLVVSEGAKYRGDANDGYWKVGVAVADPDLAVSVLRQRGWQVSTPSQFRDIGYLCHLRDRDGMTIELLGHHFQERTQPREADPTLALGTPPTLGQVTLRIGDPERSLAFYREKLGLTLLSVQKVEPYRFTLYFLAGTQEQPPEPDLESVANREWLWQRPYPTLELQHRWGQSPTPAAGEGLGYQCLVFGQGNQAVRDPDGHDLRI